MLQQVISNTRTFLDREVLYTENNAVIINLLNNKIGTNGACILNKTLQNISIADLTLGGDRLFDDDAQCLAQAFKGTKIMKLNINSSHIMQTNGIKYLVQIFKDSQIANLNVRARDIKTDGAKYLAEFLKEINVLDLDLYRNDIGDDGVKYLTPALKINTIMHLDLSFNFIRANGAKYLSEILKDTQITFLNLCSNDIGVDGAKYLANGLKYSQVTGLRLRGNMIQYEGYQYLRDVIEDTNISSVNLRQNGIEKGFKKGTELCVYTIPRNTTTIANQISAVFKALVSFNIASNEFEFIVPSKNAFSFEFDPYVFLIMTLNNNPNVKAHIFEMMCRNDLDTMKKINEFIITLSYKFNTFINNNLPALLDSLGDYNWLNLVKEFEVGKLYEIVQNLLLHRELYYLDENQEILHPYIYKLLHKYDIILYNSDMEPNKKDEIISYYQNHPEIDGGLEIVDLLKSESFL